MKKYIVAVDFGHGETAAYVMPLSDSEFVLRDGSPLNIFQGNHPHQKVAPSVVYHLDTNTGDPIYDMNGNGKLITAFKGKISELKEDKQNAYRGFIQAVFQRIVDNNGCLEWTDADGWNFYFCIACPTRWNDTDRDKYVSFFNDALSKFGVTVRFVMNESDAACFAQMDVHDTHDNLVLVIDYGSSTIDYTLIEDGKKISDDGWSNPQLGANAIEKTLLEKYKDQCFEDYNSARERTINILTKSGNVSLIDNIDSQLEYQLRKTKEEVYTSGTLQIRVDFNLFKTTGIQGLRDVVFHIDFTNIDEVIASYRKAVKNDFTKLKEKIEIKTGKMPGKILLSGGACCMPWMNECVETLFPDATIIQDNNPSFIVAKGIARYAKAQIDCLKKLEKAVRRIDYKKIYLSADEGATKTILMGWKQDKFLKGIEKRVNSNNMKTAMDLHGYMLNFMRCTDDSYSEFKTANASARNKLFGERIYSAVNEIVNEQFALSLRIEPVPIDINVPQFIYQQKDFIPDGDLYEVIKRYIDMASNKFFGITWDKERTYGELKNWGEKAYDTYIDNYKASIEQKNLDSVANNMEEKAVKIAESLFYEHQLFKTTFV